MAPTVGPGDDVLPYYLKLERDADFDSGSHGHDGPMPIMRLPRADWPGLLRCRMRRVRARRIYVPARPQRRRHQWRLPDAVFNVDGHRVSSAMAYLGAEVRRRPNLKILPNILVEEIAFEGQRATGVVLSANGERRIVAGREIIVSAGVMQSPALLLRAGIGPADHLAAHGIAVRSHRSGVGSNLQDHPTIAIASYIRASARMPAAMRRHIHLGVRYSSGPPRLPAWRYVRPAGQSGGLACGRPRLSRRCSSGSIGRLSPRPGPSAIAPVPGDDLDIDLNLLSDERDLVRLADGARRVAALYRDTGLGRRGTRTVCCGVQRSSAADVRRDSVEWIRRPPWRYRHGARGRRRGGCCSRQ